MLLAAGEVVFMISAGLMVQLRDVYTWLYSIRWEAEMKSGVLVEEEMKSGTLVQVM